ncbi:hypothetical protein GGR42_000851 [Saonia flava]|uniref:Uncharacterized protein n=1 Tax=Saonia flava TaxID=523696 RepID=A0A846R0J1_9FLAO|nr:hypothetical protein [Saonia flava]NJB70389.1 hypothetical protein [Saonia flava]
MKKAIAFLLLLLVAGCNGQEKEKPEIKKEEKKETAEKPKGQWEVKKEYDEFGNLIKYDSIYSYSYSNIEGDSLKVNLDSIMDSFRDFFDERVPFSWKDRFSYFPETDSLFMKDFFTEDYFFKNWEKQHSELQEMMKKMDSTRNAFLKKYHPGLLESKENN